MAIYATHAVLVPRHESNGKQGGQRDRTMPFSQLNCSLEKTVIARGQVHRGKGELLVAHAITGVKAPRRGSGGGGKKMTST